MFSFGLPYRQCAAIFLHHRLRKVLIIEFNCPVQSDAVIFSERNPKLLLLLLIQAVERMKRLQGSIESLPCSTEIGVFLKVLVRRLTVLVSNRRFVVVDRRRLGS